ncbi:hypothetical protein TNCV_5018041 [Trichonephila clavipes]|nr:hypothetical protein TNCV_5018041 [Trichonephila clavipes]
MDGTKFNTVTDWYRHALNCEPKIASIENNRPTHGTHWRLTRSELIDLSDDDNAASKTYESHILKEETGSDESVEKKHIGIFEMKRQFWIILYHKKH